MLISTDLRPTTGAVSPEHVTVQSFIVVKYSLFLQQPGLAKYISLFTKHLKALQLLALLNPFPVEQSTQLSQLSQTGKEHIWKQDAKWPSKADRSACL